MLQEKGKEKKKKKIRIKFKERRILSLKNIKGWIFTNFCCVWHLLFKYFESTKEIYESDFLTVSTKKTNPNRRSTWLERRRTVLVGHALKIRRQILKHESISAESVQELSIIGGDFLRISIITTENSMK